MSFRTTARLLIAVCVVGILIWILDPEEPRHLEAIPLLARMKIEQVQRVHIERETWQAQVERRDGVWHVVRPVDTRADAAVIDRMLSVLDRLTQLEVITAMDREERQLTLEDYELTQPRAQLEIATSARSWRLSLGCGAPLGGSVYVQIDDSRDVVSTSTNLLDVIPQNLEDIRERMIFGGLPSEIARIDIKRPGRSFIRLLRVNGDWQIEQPIKARADSVAVSELIEDLFAASIVDFVLDPAVEGSDGVAAVNAGLAAYGLAEADEALAVTVWRNSDELGQGLIIRESRGPDELVRHARIDGSKSVFTIPGLFVDRLMGLRVRDLRDRVIFSVSPREIAGIRVTEGEYKLSLRRDGYLWHVVEPTQWTADSDLVARLIASLINLEASEFVDGPVTNLAAFGLAPPAFGLSIVRAGADPSNGETPVGDDATTTQLFVGRPVFGLTNVYAHFEGEEVLYALDLVDIWPILESSMEGAEHRFTDPLHYRDRVMMSLDPAHVRRIGLRRGPSEQIVERDADGVWTAVMPTGMVAQAAAIEDDLIAAAELRALRIEAQDPDDVAVYGFKDETLVLTFGLSGPEGIEKRLLVGFRSRRDGVYAMIQGQDLVFVLDAPTVARIAQDLTASPPPAAEASAPDSVE